jgi:hypothetical protein
VVGVPDDGVTGDVPITVATSEASSRMYLRSSKVTLVEVAFWLLLGAVW